MKKCPYCSALLHDNDRFCLHCMNQLSSPRRLPSYGKHRYSIFISFILLLLILFLIPLSLQLYGPSRNLPSISTAYSSTESLPSGTLSVDSSSTMDKPEEPSPESRADEDSIVSKPESTKGESSLAFKNESSNFQTPAKENPPISSNQSSAQESFLSAEEFFEKMTRLEEQELKSRAPNVKRTHEDLGPYSQRLIVENRFPLIAQEDFDSVYQKSPELRMELSEPVLDTFQNDLDIGDASGSYNWKLIQIQQIVGTDGQQYYFIQVCIQIQANDPAITACGIDTQAVVKQVRSHLSQKGQRVNALPQNRSLHNLSLSLDTTGELSTNSTGSPRNQQEMIQILCKKLDAIIEEYGYTSYRFDFRLVSIPSTESSTDHSDLKWFTFSFYLESQ